MEVENTQVVNIAREIAGNDADFSTVFTNINNAIQEGRVAGLDEKLWSTLTNTDSFGIRFGDMDEAFRMAHEDGKEPEKILEQMKSGLPMQMPIILIKKDGTPHLLSGNTRLILGMRRDIPVRHARARRP